MTAQKKSQLFKKKHDPLMNVEKKPPALGNLNEFLHPGGECQNLNQLVVCGVCVLCAVVVIRVRHKVVCLYTYPVNDIGKSTQLCGFLISPTRPMKKYQL